MEERGLSGTRMGVPLDAAWTCAEHVISLVAGGSWQGPGLTGLALASACSRERGADDDEAARTERWRRELAQPAPDPLRTRYVNLAVCDGEPKAYVWTSYDPEALVLPDEAVSYPFDSGEVLRFWRRGTRKVTDDLTLAAMALKEAQVALVEWHDVPGDDAVAMVAWVSAEWRL